MQKDDRVYLLFYHLFPRWVTSLTSWLPFLDDEGLPICGSLLLERICSSVQQILFFKRGTRPRGFLLKKGVILHLQAFVQPKHPQDRISRNPNAENFIAP